MEGQDSVHIVDVLDVRLIPAQPRLAPANLDQLRSETQMIGHRLVGAFHALPPDQIAGHRIVAEWFILKELLPHEQHRNSGSGQKKSRRHAAAAAGVPGTRVRGIGQSWNARTFSYLYDVVVLNTLNGAPARKQTLGLNSSSNAFQIHVCIRAARSLSDHPTHGLAQSILPCSIETGNPFARRLHHPRIHRPVLSNLNCLGFTIA